LNVGSKLSLLLDDEFHPLVHLFVTHRVSFPNKRKVFLW
jgi:hypothetical protein